MPKKISVAGPLLIDGREHAARMKQYVSQHFDELRYEYHLRPGLAIVRIGDNPASQVYVASKKRQCREVGIRSFEHHLANHTTTEELTELIQELNTDPEVHGIIVQLPLPNHIKQNDVLFAIAPQKDVDGLHPENLGRLFIGAPHFVPCTPLGCLELIRSVEPRLDGKHVVVVGASNLVGKPMAQLMLNQGCSVTTLHSRSVAPDQIAKQADILIVAVGKAKLVNQSWVKHGAIVIDVGINRILNDDGTTDIVGDVDFDDVKDQVKAITPVPGGVGPMTVVSLLINTLKAAENSVRSQNSSKAT